MDNVVIRSMAANMGFGHRFGIVWALIMMMMMMMTMMMMIVMFAAMFLITAKHLKPRYPEVWKHEKERGWETEEKWYCVVEERKTR